MALARITSGEFLATYGTAMKLVLFVYISI
jgi:hypothetical protein